MSTTFPLPPKLPATDAQPKNTTAGRALESNESRAAAPAPAPAPASGAKKGWFSSLLGGNIGSAESDGKGPSAHADEEETLRKQVREYEAKLAEMSNLASRQADDISSLRTVAEKSLHEKALAEARAAAVAEATAAQASAAQQSSTSSFDEERWRQLMAEANSTQEQALANGQRQLHALAASLQAAQRMAAEQQAAEWRAALHEASEAHALVVRQLQSQLMASSEEKRALQQDLREARRASLERGVRTLQRSGEGGGRGGEAADRRRSSGATLVVVVFVC